MTDTKQIEHCSHPVAQPDHIEDVRDMVSKAMRRAFSMGQTYWQQADHEFVSQNKKADETQSKFEQLVDETRDAIRSLKQQAPEPASALKFANHIINGVFEGGDWDGGELQSLAVQYGLLKPVEMKEPCAEEGCQCVANGADFPAICYRKTYLAAMGKDKP